MTKQREPKRNDVYLTPDHGYIKIDCCINWCVLFKKIKGVRLEKCPEGNPMKHYMATQRYFDDIAEYKGKLAPRYLRLFGIYYIPDNNC